MAPPPKVGGISAPVPATPVAAHTPTQKNPFFSDIAEELLVNVPQCNCFGVEEDFPLGWFLNYKGDFNDLFPGAMEMRR